MTKRVYVKDIPIGGGAPITVQSMTDTPTADTKATLERIAELYAAGCDIVRVSVPDTESVSSLKTIVELSPIPVVADIHFDYRLAIDSVLAGAHKIRINPSNFPDNSLRELALLCKERCVPMRIGVNEGSEKAVRTPKELAELAVKTAEKIANYGHEDLVLAVKTSNVRKTVESYRILSKLTDLPLHIGLTEAGTPKLGITKSTVAIGTLLTDGIGDTIRVSLTADPVREVVEGRKILRAVGLDTNFTEVIACPTCARTQIDVKGIAERMESLTQNSHKPLKIAVMGCVVNGVGESRGADFGVCGGKEKSIIYVKGKQYKVVCNDDIISELALLAEEYNG